MTYIINVLRIKKFKQKEKTKEVKKDKRKRERESKCRIENAWEKENATGIEQLRKQQK